MKKPKNESDREEENLKILFLLLFLIVGCLPEDTPRVLDESSSNSINYNNSPTNNSNSSLHSQSKNYFQEGVRKEESLLALPFDFNDSFYLRGNNLHNYLKQIDYSTKLCLAFYFSASVNKKVLLMSAQIRTNNNFSSGETEYFLKINVNEEVANQTDCQVANITNSLNDLYSVAAVDITYAYESLCPNCSQSIVSSQAKIFQPSGEEDTHIEISHLNLQRLNGSNSSVSTSCTSNASCSALGYDCCLSKQCINHGSIRYGVDTNSNEYLMAENQIENFPWKLKDYAHLFYVCPNLVAQEPQTEEETTNPEDNANLLKEELTNLYNCLNPYQDEFSICTLEEKNASLKIGTTGYTFTMPKSDLTFQSINNNMVGENIYSIYYANQILYKENSTALAAINGVLGADNDTISSGQSVTITAPKPNNAVNDTLRINYKIDGTCKRLGSSLARCTKYYKQAQMSIPARSSDHTSGNQTFKLPSYVDTTKSIVVKVNDVQVSRGVGTWDVSGTNIVFDNAYPIYDNQSVSIMYYVSTGVNDLLAAREEALAQVQNHCKCADEDCNLNPIYNEVNGALEFYSCVYPQPVTPTPPLQQTIYISSRSVAHRYFDSNGVHYDYDKIAQGLPQEGVEFKYLSNDFLRPNNVSNHIGFNEIYGSFNRAVASSMPATSLTVSKGKTYDIFTDSGVFSTCLSCGSDYYSNLQKIFPDNFIHMGAGYVPSAVESRRKDNKSSYRADDLLFGRACFLPATMIPWTHAANTDLQDQRLNRLSAQHFLFANGYNKDWFGFDYGSLIGSFDGVSWFAIGNQRRIKANTNKLYIAVNAYFGDVTAANSFRVTVSEIAPVINSGSNVNHDTNSDGAQCQKYHYCSTDNDCITQLGYDYMCMNVSGITSNWPSFDNNSNEIFGSSSRTLLSLLGGANGQVKRCVYRGKGAPCHFDPYTRTTSYAGTTLAQMQLCSPNHYCADLSNDSVFNTKISRFARAPALQNSSSYVPTDSDTVGLAARILGRSYQYYGDQSTPASVLSQLNSNSVTHICVPGKAPAASTTTEDLQEKKPSIADGSADKNFGIGKTMDESISFDPEYMSACPATDHNGNYANLTNQSLTGGASLQKRFSVAQNLSTNLLKNSIFDALDLFNDDDGGVVTKLGLGSSSCLRTAGSPCFTDLDCAPSDFIANKVKTITDFGTLNEAEVEFWKEGLTCANDNQRYITNSIYETQNYDLKKHKCCRETNKNFTFYSQPHTNSPFTAYNAGGAPQVAGVDIAIDSDQRYSRVNTVYDKVTSDPSNFPATIVASPDTGTIANGSYKEKQYNTLHLHNKRMCCTGHWVREFASGTNGNGGGHKFESTKMQNIAKESFRNISWNNNTNTDTAFFCKATNWDTSACEIRNISEGSAEEKKYLDWLGTLELVGIPQIIVKTSSTINQIVNNSQSTAPANTALDQTIKSVASHEKVDVVHGGVNHYSAANYENFEIGNGKMKKIFSENKFACCLPTGVEIDKNTPNEACCTGQATDQNGPARCCLNDFVNVSVYTNRYVSSEGAGLNDSDYDPVSGYIKSKEKVMELAATMCCSGEATYGIALSDLLIPLEGGTALPEARTRRFVYDDEFDNSTEVGGRSSIYDAGARWNNHVYCVPKGYTVPAGNAGSGGGSGSVSE